MTSSSSLYGSTPQSGNISSSNLTTLYSGNAAPIPNGNLVVPGTLTINGCAILTNCNAFSLLPTNAESILFGGAATSMLIGAGTGVTTINNQLATANYTFPVADGVAGQVLVTNGTGTVSFASVGSLGVVTSITGTANQIIASSATGAVTLSTPQDIATTSTPTFAGATLGNITVGVSTDNTITTTTGNLILDATTNLVNVNAELYVDSPGYQGGNIRSTGDNKFITFSQSSTSTNVPQNGVRLSVESTGTPAVGFGTNLQYQIETAPGVLTNAALIQVESTDITPGAEDFKMDFKLTSAGVSQTRMTLDDLGNLALDAGLTTTIITIDTRATIDTATLTTTSTATVPLTTSVRNTMSGLVYIVQGTDVHCVNFTILKTSASTAMLTTYGEMYDNVSLATFSADVSAGSIRLLVTPASATSTVFSAVRTSLT